MDIADVTSKVQLALDKVSDWCLKWGFRVSTSKSSVVLFTKKRKVIPVRLKIRGAELSVRKEYKYLGVIFDSRLTYKEHANLVRSSERKKQWNLQIISNKLKIGRDVP